MLFKFCVITFVFLVSIKGQSTQTENEEPLVVPKPVMSFILGCDKSQSQEELIPVYRTDIDAESGTTSQQVSLLELDELQTSLKVAIESDDVTSHIMDRIREEFNAGPKFNKATYQAESCPPTTNVINIDVPPQELEVFHTRMERVMQQNNNVLMRLINNMISSKFTIVEQNLSKLMTKKSSEIMDKLDKVLSKLGDEKTVGLPNIRNENEDSEDEEVVTENTPDVKSDDTVEATTPESTFAKIVQAIQAADEQEVEALKETETEDEDSTTAATDVEEDSTPGRREVEGPLSNLGQLLYGPPSFALSSRLRNPNSKNRRRRA